MHCIKDALWSSSNAKMQQLTNHSQPLFFSKRIISHWDFCFVFSCLFFLAAGFAVFVATIFWIFVPIAGIGVQLLANSLSLIMAHSTTPSLSSAEPTRPGLQQRSLTNALVSISFNINLSKISLSLSGSKCVNPPKPDAARKMIVSWNPDYPPAHNEAITYKCDAGQPYNRFESGHRLMWRILWNIAGASGSEFTVLVALDWFERCC